jgi:tagatose 6-phosphate kinase
LTGLIGIRPMILTVTLNVSIDRAYRIDELKPGDVMRVRECTCTAGGKGLNVARVAKIAGAGVMATGFAGGHAGEFVREQLEKNGIPNDFVFVNGETRSCINVIEEKTGRQTEFLEPGFTVTPADLALFMHKFDLLLEQSEVVTISGSVPAGCGNTIYADLVQHVNHQGKKVILDSSEKLLAQGILAKPTMIKPNLDEMAALTGITATDTQQLAEYAQKLQKNGIPYVVISLGRHGALLSCDEGLFVGASPDIPVINTVGCGDAMVAAFAVGFERGYTAREMLHYALGISAANAMTIETGFYRPEDLQWLLEQCSVKCF